jgi:hypothetical protein
MNMSHSVYYVLTGVGLLKTVPECQIERIKLANTHSLLFISERKTRQEFLIVISAQNSYTRLLPVKESSLPPLRISTQKFSSSSMPSSVSSRSERVVPSRK